MTHIEQQLIKKQDELIAKFLQSNVQIHMKGSYSEYQKLKDEIAALKSEMRGEDEKKELPDYLDYGR